MREQQVGGIALQQAGRLADQPVHHCLQRLCPLRFAKTDEQSDGWMGEGCLWGWHSSHVAPGTLLQLEE